MARRLLIVDDEETIRFSLCQSFIIAKKDYEVAMAASGEEALERMTEKPYDLIITDIFMPGISGLDLLQMVKEKYPETEVIVITAYGSDDKKDEAARLGARYYVEKPFEIKEIRQKVFDLLG
ncbi:MAG: response regulator [Calditrichaeota bacterium]|nr:MAG: response regulator [Calditrichota bacterium]